MARVAYSSVTATSEKFELLTNTNCISWVALSTVPTTVSEPQVAVADFTRVERACVGMNSENSASVLQEVTIPAARMMNDNILFFIALSC